MMRTFLSQHGYSLLLVSICIVALLLRAPIFTQVPSSPYWEETILGYDAFSLAQTGRDHHGSLWPIIALESFGDWKPVGYTYAILPFVKLFGMELWVVRLPSLLAGIAIIIAVGVLAKRLQIPVWMSMLVVVVAPWAIHFSRAAWEANLATALIAWAVISALVAIQPHKIATKYAAVSVLLFACAWYTYHAARIVVPLLVLGLCVYTLTSAYNRGLSYVRASSVAIGVSLLLVLTCVSPLLFNSNMTALTQRFNETGRFADPAVVLRSNELRAAAGNTLIARLMYHRYLLWSGELLSSYADNLNPIFLFLHGETNLRHTTQYFGLFYPFEFLLLLLGLYWWIRKHQPIHALLLYWLLVSLIPSALAVPTPHALRILIGLPVFALLISEGLFQASVLLTHFLHKHFKHQFDLVSSELITIVSVLAVYILFLGLFWRNYTSVYPSRSYSVWQYGYQHMYASLLNIEQQYSALPIYISRVEGRPASFLWFYRKTDPRLVQAANSVVSKDQGEFLEFEKYHFFRSIGDIPATSAIVVLSEAEMTQYQQNHIVTILQRIEDPMQHTVWLIGKQ